MSEKKRILVIEDKKASRDLLVTQLSRDYEVDAPEAQTHAEFFEELAQRYTDHNRYYFLILDMEFADDPFGGIVLRNRLCREGMQDLWEHLVICSEHVSTDVLVRDFSEVAWEGNDLAYKVFLDTIGLQKENVLNGRINLWLARLSILLAEIEGAN